MNEMEIDLSKRTPKFWRNKKLRLTKDERYLMASLLKKSIIDEAERMNIYFDRHIADTQAAIGEAFSILVKISQSSRLHRKSMGLDGGKFTEEEQKEYNVDEDGHLLKPEIETKRRNDDDKEGD